MSWKGASVLAVVPARGGSKGIPRKNLQTVGGVSLIGWAARMVTALPWLDGAVLSTDDAEMADEGRNCGLAVPFLRPPELATDGAGSTEMWKHAWLQSEEHFGTRFDCSVLLQPTTPFRRPGDVERAVQAVAERGHRSAMTVSQLPAHYAPEKCLVLDEDGRAVSARAEHRTPAPRQELPTYYWRNGACYVVSRETLVDDGVIVDDDCAAIVVEDLIVNIDDPIELDLAAFLFSRNGAPVADLGP